MFVMGYSVFPEVPCQICSVQPVSVTPTLKMFDGGESIGLILIARAVGEYKVVSEIYRIASSRDEVVDVRLVPQRPQAVEAPAGLVFDEIGR